MSSDESVRTFLVRVTKELAPCSDSARLDAELLLCHVLGWRRLDLISRGAEPLGESARTSCEALVARRMRGEPIAYLTGVREFWGLEFRVTPDVLVPRPDSELLVETTLARCDALPGALSLLELGVGSGCLSVAVGASLRERGREFRIDALDSSIEAIAVARGNIVRHDLTPQIHLEHADWNVDLPANRHYSLIFSNPPYVAESDSRVGRGIEFEPHGAIFERGDGLGHYRHFSRVLARLLVPGGTLLCEIGDTQARAVTDLFNEAGMWEQPEVRRDLAGRDRVIVVRAR